MVFRVGLGISARRLSLCVVTRVHKTLEGGMEGSSFREWEASTAEFGLGVMWTPRASFDIGESNPTKFDFMLQPGTPKFFDFRIFKIPGFCSVPIYGETYFSSCPLHLMWPNTTRVGLCLNKGA